MSVEYLKMLNLLLREEWAGHRTVELPRGTVRVEDSMTKKRAHKPKKPLSYETAQRHFGRRRWSGSKPFPNLSKSVAKIDCHDEMGGKKRSILRQLKFA